jgi:hypothetical protein
MPSSLSALPPPILDAMLKVRPDVVAAPWSYGDARRALHYALMDRAPEMVRMLMRAVEEHSTRVGLPVGPFRLGETVLERGADPLESDAEPWADGLGTSVPARSRTI